MTQTATQSRYERDDRVEIVQHTCAPREDCKVTNRRAVFVEYTQPHGYARVDVQGIGLWLVHPENLRLAPLCAVEGCGFYHLDLSDYCASHG
jgi:hypothetical protein